MLSPTAMTINAMTINAMPINAMPINAMTINAMTINAKSLPSNVLALISAYSKPCTNPKWRSRQWICIGEIYKEIIAYKNCIDNIYIKRSVNKYDTHFRLYKQFLLNVQNNYGWFNIYDHYLCMGLDNTSIEYGIPIKILKKILITHK